MTVAADIFKAAKLAVAVTAAAHVVVNMSGSEQQRQAASLLGNDILGMPVALRKKLEEGAKAACTGTKRKSSAVALE